MHPGERVIFICKRKAGIAVKGMMEEHEKDAQPTLDGERRAPPPGQETGSRVKDKPEEERIEIAARGARGHQPAGGLQSRSPVPH